MQSSINKFFQALGAILHLPTASAFCQARQKLKPELFIHLNEEAAKDYYRLYGEDGRVRKWRGHRVLGVDGTVLNLPDNEEMREHFSVQTNQHAEGSRVQALASVMYDLLNDIGITADLGPKQAEKNFLFSDHFKCTQAGDLIVTDRNYGDYCVMAMAKKYQRDFLIRFSQSSFSKVNEFWASDKTDEIVQLRASNNAKQFVRENQLAETLLVRLIKVELDNGEIEVLGTSLIDQKVYPKAEFKTVYSWRWGSETYYDRVKNIFELERFSGTSKLTIEQDFHGVIFLATLEAILTKSTQAELITQSQERNCKLTPQVNRALSYSALLDKAVSLFCDNNKNSEDTLAELRLLFRSNPVRHASGRAFERPKRSNARSLRFFRYVKRIIS